MERLRYDFEVIALFQKQQRCSSNKATTMYRQAGKNVRQFPARHDRAGDSRKNNMRFAPTTVCRRTINSPFVSISIVCELSKYIELFSVFGNISTGEFFGSMAIWTTSCLWDVRSRVLALGAGSGIWQAFLRRRVTAL